MIQKSDSEPENLPSGATLLEGSGNARTRMSFWIAASLFAIWMTIASLCFLQAMADVRLCESNTALGAGRVQDHLQQELDHVTRDLRFLASAFTEVNPDGPMGESPFGSRLAAFCETQQRYFQARLIDLDGQEQIRIEYDHESGEATTSPDLQDKSDRYYFQVGRKLAKGEVYISEFDLNVEQGAIERPFVPVMRFITPVTSANDTIRGLLVLNFEGQQLLSEVRRLGFPAESCLVRADGHFIIGPRPEAEWGWLLSRDVPETVAYRELVKEILESPNSPYDRWNAKGFMRVSPSLLRWRQTVPVVHESDLYLVSHVPLSNAFALTMRLTVLLFFVGLTASLIVTYSLSQARRHAMRRAEAATELRLEREKLRLSNAELRHANEDLDNFASAASHDLKAPLRAISYLATWLAEDIGDDMSAKSREYFQEIRQRVQRLELMLTDLLLYAKCGRAPGNKECVELSRCCHQVVDLLGIPQGFSVNASISTGPVLLNRPALETILRNVILNAVAHHDRETGTIEVSAVCDEGNVEIRITDDGPGIPETSREEVFKMFRTLPSKSGSSGSGIGLTIVRRVVAAEGGSVRLEAGEPRGTQFIIRLPIGQSREVVR